ncbi:MAG: type II toxin-antitoxin system prevent-host-death family antitoxin [Coriobacteriia bacterium]|nr:type II toxin-antitoxin system prevent-host-death family antitoxin [Coriobacteriia bacterium]MCL2605670.1 type II toxin-antitoxin system prevent-host-death family antitoxin [Coriobacteriia bacterium]
MTVKANMQEAKTNLSKLVAASLAGEEVIISNRGVAMVQLVPCEQPAKRELGFIGGKEHWSDAFFDSLPEDELALWGL